MVTFNKQLSKNVLLVCGDLNNWGYKEVDDSEEYDSIPYAKCFELTFKFYDCDFTAYFSQSNIEKESFEPISLEGDGDLFDSFDQKMEDEEFKDDIKAACEKIWKESLEWL